MGKKSPIFLFLWEKDDILTIVLYRYHTYGGVGGR